jgi:hypothetical protein
LQARVARLEEQLAAANAARVSTAERVEGMSSGLHRLDRYEKGLVELRAEVAGVAGEAERKTAVAIKEAAAGWARAAERLGRQADDVAHRLGVLEGAKTRDDSAKRLDSLVRAQAELGTLIERLADRVQAVEHASPRTDPAVVARIDAADTGLVTLRRAFDDWQRRIEQQTEVVR